MIGLSGQPSPPKRWLVTKVIASTIHHTPIASNESVARSAAAPALTIEQAEINDF